MPYEETVSATTAGPVRGPWGRRGDDLLFVYTGGTTGMPKGVMWRQDDLWSILNRSATVPVMAATPDPGACPACALSRWQRVHATISAVGWRTVREQLAGLGDAPAGTETTHDCTRPIPWLQPGAAGSRPPLFSPIDRHGAPEVTWPLSTRSITTIVAARLHTATHNPIMPSDCEDGPETAGRRRAWDETDRQRVRDEHKQAVQRLAAIDTLIDEADAYAEAILERLNADLNGSTEPGNARLE